MGFRKDSKRTFLHLLAAVLLMAAAQAGLAAPGQLDNSFGTGGIARYPLGPSGYRPASIAVLSDGKVLVGGNSLGGTQGVVSFPRPQFMLVRFNVDGSLDDDFGDEGHTRPTAYTYQGNLQAMALGPGGTIVAAGTAGQYGSTVMAVARYDANGALDTDFGERTVSFPVGDTLATALAVQPDGKILLGGSVDSGGNPFFAIARLNTDGSLDTTFNGTGRLAFAIGSASQVTAVLLQPDGKIVLAGYANMASYDFAVARVNANGTLDTSFGCATPGTCTGFTTLDFAGSSELAYAAALQPDGRVVVVGSYSDNNFRCAIARFNANGTPDNTFGFGGRATAASSNDCDGVVVQPDQKLLLRSGGLLIRRHANSFPDETFGNGGTALGLTGGTGLALSGGGEIVIAGQRNYNTGSDTFQQIALVAKRFLSEGAPDPTFAGGSTAEARFALGALAQWNAVTVQPDGGIVAAGYAIGMQELQHAGLVARFHPSGAPDASFGQGRGWVLTSAEMVIEGVEVLVDGRIVVAGNRGDSEAPVVVQRFLPDGTQDATLNNGTGRYELDNGTQGVANAMAVKPNGTIVLAGYSSLSDGDFLAGQVFDGFTGSLYTVDMGSTSDSAQAIALRPDGRAILAGRSGTSMSILALTSGGGIDSTFNGNGKTGIAFGANSTARAVAVAPDGKVVVAGTTSLSSGIVAVARLTSVGALDTTFNGTGKVTTDILADTGEQVGAVLVQADGKILVGASSGSSFYVLRYDVNGSLDTSFSSGAGLLTVPIATGATLTSMALQPDGRLVLAGYSGGQVPVLARVLLESTPAFPGFASVFNAALSVDVTSATSAPTNFSGTIPISIVNGSYSINCAPGGFTTLPGNITSGTQLCVRHRTSSLPGDTVTSTLYLGVSNATFSSTTAKTTAAVGLFSSANPSSIEAPVTLTATVSGQYGNPTGLVTFRDGTIVLGVASPNSFGVAQITTSSLVVGSHALSATYAGDATYLLGTASLTQTVTGNALTVSVATPVTTVTYGTAISLNATLSPAPGNGTLVVFKDASNAIGVATVNGTTASFLTRSLAVGTHPITVSFVPSGLYGAATSLAITITVNAAASSTVVGSNVATGELGQPVVFTSLVAGPGFEFGGTVTFRDGATVIAGCSAVPLVNQLASCSTATLANGAHSITAAYSGDGNNLASTSSPISQPVSYDPLLDADHDGIPNGVEFTEARDPLVKDNDVFTSARWFAMQQYRDFLGREGDAGGIQFYADLITNGPAVRANVIESFFNSPEFAGTASPIARLYFATFLRTPDYPGLIFQINAFKAGTSLAQIATNFTNAPEFQATYGALDNAQFVALLYTNILARTASQAEIDYHVARLTSGVTRGEVLVGFSESPEFQAAIGNEVYVTMMYVGMLRRAPEPAGLTYWVTYMDAGNPGLALILGFLNAPEYHNRFLP